MAKSKNPLPKEFTAIWRPWGINDELEWIYCRCAINNGWYTVFRLDTGRKLFYSGMRWYELQRYLNEGRLVMSEIPEENCDDINLTELL